VRATEGDLGADGGERFAELSGGVRRGVAKKAGIALLERAEAI
jgi:hypothetical protein